MAAKKAPKVDMEADASEVSSTSVAALTAMIKQQHELAERVQKAADNLDKLSEEMRQLVEVTLPSFFDEVGVKEITLPDGTTVKVEEKVYPNITAENWPKAYAWFKKKGFESLVKTELKVKFGKGEGDKFAVIQELLVENGVEDYSSKTSINPQTLGAFVREQMAAGKDLPPTIDINQVRKAVVKAAKATKSIKSK